MKWGATPTELDSCQPHTQNENMEEFKQLKKQNAELLLSLQQVRNATLEEAALICSHPSNSDLSREELTAAIRSKKDEIHPGGNEGELAEVWVEKGMEVRHIRTGHRYIVLDLAQAELNEQSREAVVFKSAGDGRVFVRETGTFCASFEKVDGSISATNDAADLPDEWRSVMNEIERAKRKFPTWPTDPLHAVAVLGEEFGELTKAVLQTIYEPHKVQEGELRTEAIQTAAMTFRFLASLGRYEFTPCAQHEQTSALSAVRDV